MPKINFWKKAVTRVEFDQRAREGRLQLERLEQLLVNNRSADHRQAPGLLRSLRLYLLLNDRRPFPNGMGVRSRHPPLRTRTQKDQRVTRSRVRNRSRIMIEAI